MCLKIKSVIRCTVPPADSDVRLLVPNSSSARWAPRGSDDLGLFQWQNLEIRCTGSFGGSTQYSIISFGPILAKD